MSKFLFKYKDDLNISEENFGIQKIVGEISETGYSILPEHIKKNTLDEILKIIDYTKEESEAGYKNFCVIRCKIKSIEWLYLAAKGHRRALFDLENNKKNWLVP